MFERSRWGQGLLGQRYDAHALEPCVPAGVVAPALSEEESAGIALARLWLLRTGRKAVQVAVIDSEQVILSLFGSALDQALWRPLVGMSLFEVLHLGGGQFHVLKEGDQWQVRFEATRFSLHINGEPMVGVVASIEDGDHLSVNTLEFLFLVEGGDEAN